MKKILLKLGNEDPVAEALARVNGRAAAHTITDFSQLARVIEAAERDLIGRGATKRSSKGRS